MNNVGIRADAMDPESFEKFANELCSILFDKEIQGFTRGKDMGIDGIDDICHPTIIIQAKRWSPYKTTAAKEIEKEVQKIKSTIQKYGWKEKIRYVIVTSAGLITEVKIKLLSKYKDLFWDEDSLIDCARIDDYSRIPKYENVYRNYNLIESNLGLVLKKDRIESIVSDYPGFDAKFFVETNFFDRAFSIVMDKHILLVHGNPGVGKSTLCKMLGYVFANRFSLDSNSATSESVRVIWRSPEEMSQLINQFDSTFRGTKNQLFVVLDDFLGSNSLTTNSSDMEILRRLLDRVRENDNLYIVLNSRTQILESAENDYLDFFSDLNRGDKDVIKMLDMSDYTSIDRAKLLRKIMEREYSSLEKDEKKIFKENYDKLRLPNTSKRGEYSVKKAYNDIIEHRNFNPRLIEYISLNFTAPNGIIKLIKDTLDNPHRIYDSLFDKMDMNERWILFSLFTFSDVTIPEKKLLSVIHPFVQPAFDAEPVLKKFEHTWLRSEMERIDSRKIGYANPGIRDYLSAKNEKIHFTDIIKKKALYLCQLQDFLSRDEFNQIIIERWQEFLDKDKYQGEYAAAYFRSGCDSERALTILNQILQNYHGEWHLDSSNGWFEVLSSLKKGPFKLLTKVFDFLIDKKRNGNKFSDIFATKMSLEEFDTIVDLFLPSIVRKYNYNPEDQEIFELNKDDEAYSLIQLILTTKKEILQDTINNQCGDYWSEAQDMILEGKAEKEIIENIIDSILKQYGGKRLRLYEQLFDFSQVQLNDRYSIDKVKSLINDTKKDLQDLKYDEYRLDDMEEEYAQAGIDSTCDSNYRVLDDSEQIDSILDKPISNV